MAKMNISNLARYFTPVFRDIVLILKEKMAHIL